MKLRMVDCILEWKAGSRIRGIKAVSFEEYQLKSAFGGPAALPEALALGAVFELASWLVILSSGFSLLGVVAKASRVSFGPPLRPGERMEIDVEAEKYREGTLLFRGRGACGARAVVEAEGCVATPAELKDHFDPEDLRALFGEIHRSREAGP